MNTLINKQTSALSKSKVPAEQWPEGEFPEPCKKSASIIYIKTARAKALFPLNEFSCLTDYGRATGDGTPWTNMLFHGGHFKADVAFKVLSKVMRDVLAAQYNAPYTRFFVEVDFSDCPEGAITFSPLV
ncbi:MULTISPECIES: hypothetical protein [unclassified Pantoea]|uniref:hypothetical protein n=1 Tax=unclassified Pantoea TaxID=2630326 RepID=UPI00123217DC|nr:MULTISPECIES: hypothetical protein [unclassified Pantoea]KAA5952032.1 hypothetical protein F3I55_18245 [Pantoea sp. VH_24]KAA5953438.1 hypothetical protein F3I53_22405 [Pantoea sp. VH_16]KAA5961620.1 hypothetical protein F3I54_19085 [Pantoea sp. VH_18]KAA5993328.1 hypothetical protein F3I46_18720 [Pantoea sp. M_1]KAA5998092.1 hypothetical protein F3I45_19365 [Pantoea sp. F_7]